MRSSRGVLWLSHPGSFNSSQSASPRHSFLIVKSAARLTEIFSLRLFPWSYLEYFSVFTFSFWILFLLLSFSFIFLISIHGNRSNYCISKCVNTFVLLNIFFFSAETSLSIFVLLWTKWIFSMGLPHPLIEFQVTCHSFLLILQNRKGPNSKELWPTLTHTPSAAFKFN